MLKFDKLTGLVAAPYTPMKKSGNIKYDTIKPYANLLANSGVSGAFICGTTGEGMSLSSEERMKVAETWQKQARPDFKIIVHVGHTSYAEAAKLAQHAQKIGCAAVGCQGPCFFKPPSTKELVEYCRLVAQAAEEIPFYYYHMPSMSGIYTPMADFLAEADGKIPNLAGIKFTYEDLMDFQKCIEAFNGKYDMLFGRDEILLLGLTLGAKGAVGSTYNYMPKAYLDIIELYEADKNDQAKALQQDIIKIIDILIEYGGGIVGGKAFMGLTGLEMGPCRIPLASRNGNTMDTLTKKLKQTKFFDYCLKA